MICCVAVLDFQLFGHAITHVLDRCTHIAIERYVCSIDFLFDMQRRIRFLGTAQIQRPVTRM